MDSRFGNCIKRKDWREARLKDCFSYGKGLNITKADLVEDGTPVISYGQIHAKQNDGTHLKGELLRYVPDEVARENPGARLKAGDIVFADTSEDLDGIGNCVINDIGDGVYAGYHTLIARAKDPRNSKYLSYLFQTDCWREQLRKRACGIKVFSLTQRLLSNVKVVLPPRPEQERIAAFLDEKCATVYKAIEVKRKQLESLGAIWKNLLYRATTQGLSMQTRMIASGNTFFPWIPEGWEVQKLARCFDLIGSGTTPKTHIQDYYDGNIPWLQSGDLHGHYVSETAKCVNQQAIEDCNLTIYKAPFLAVAMYGASIANASIVKLDACTNQACCTLCHPRPNIDPDFVYYSLEALRDSLLLQARGGTQPNVSREIIRRLKIALPPILEQQEIIRYLDKQQVNLDSLAANLRKQIETLEQYRKSLIHEYVTGVRRVV